jgi:hypothetical protein
MSLGFSQGQCFLLDPLQLHNANNTRANQLRNPGDDFLGRTLNSAASVEHACSSSLTANLRGFCSVFQ